MALRFMLLLVLTYYDRTFKICEVTTTGCPIQAGEGKSVTMCFAVPAGIAGVSDQLFCFFFIMSIFGSVAQTHFPTFLVFSPNATLADRSRPKSLPWGHRTAASCLTWPKRPRPAGDLGRCKKTKHTRDRRANLSSMHSFLISSGIHSQDNKDYTSHLPRL